MMGQKEKCRLLTYPGLDSNQDPRLTNNEEAYKLPPVQFILLLGPPLPLIAQYLTQGNSEVRMKGNTIIFTKIANSLDPPALDG